MRKIVVRIIGLVALASGVYTLYNAVLSTLNPAESVIFLSQINKLALAWVAVYGGYHALQARELGRKMLVAWFSYQILIMVILALVFLYNLLAYPESNFRLTYSNQNLTIWFFVFCIPILIFLAKIKLTQDLLISDSRHIKIVGKLMSVLSPGMGQMLVGNIWQGMGLSTLYMILVVAKLVFISTSNGSIFADPTVNFVYGLIVWGIFSQIDWHAVENYERSEKEQSTLDPKADSVQSSGG